MGTNDAKSPSPIAPERPGQKAKFKLDTEKGECKCCNLNRFDSYLNQRGDG